MDDITSTLRHFAHQPAPDRVERAVEAVRPHEDATVRGLADALGDPDDDLRILAVQVLYELGPAAEPALPAMIRALEDPRRLVRFNAVGGVTSVGEKAAGAVPILERWLDSDDEFSRIAGAAASIQIEQAKTGDLLPVLVESLESSHIGMRCQAAWSLAALGETGSPAVPDLKRLLDNESSAVRCAAAESIWTITGDSTDAVKVGLDLLDGPEWLERVGGAETLGGLGKTAEPAVPRLREALNDEDEAVREAVSTALHEIETGR